MTSLILLLLMLLWLLLLRLELSIFPVDHFRHILGLSCFVVIAVWSLKSIFWKKKYFEIMGNIFSTTVKFTNVKILSFSTFLKPSLNIVQLVQVKINICDKKWTFSKKKWALSIRNLFSVKLYPTQVPSRSMPTSNPGWRCPPRRRQRAGTTRRSSAEDIEPSSGKAPSREAPSGSSSPRRL
jgi:hypothetical protein